MSDTGNQSEAFRYLLRVRYGECDAQQVVFNSRYADYIDVAATEFTRALWGDYNSLLEQGIDNQVVNLNISWRAAARFDDVLVLTITTQAVGNTSYTLAVQFENLDTGQLLAEASITYVVVEAKTLQKMPVPGPMRSALNQGAAGVIVNHAGVTAG